MLPGFCSEYQFDARDTAAGDVRSNFNMRMQHIRDHIVSDGYRAESMQTDGHLVRHLLDRNIIDRGTYDRIISPASVPPLPGSHGRHSSHRSSNHGHRQRLPQVEEEVVAESSSRRSEHRREHNREHGSSSRKHRHHR